MLDQKGPVVKIESPYEDAVLNANFTVVKWTVNGEEQDTLKVQGLENGVNTIVRVFRDKAGNESRDSVHVMVKKAREIDIDVEKPVTTVDRDSVEKYYKDNPPKNNSNNRRPHFINPEKTNLAVPENATKAIAGTIRAVDDEGDVFRFRIVGGTAKDLFDINQTTGVVTMKDGVDPFDYEAWYELKKDDPTKEPYDIKVEICDAKATSYNVLLCDDFTFKVSIQDVNILRAP